MPSKLYHWRNEDGAFKYGMGIDEYVYTLKAFERSFGALMSKYHFDEEYSLHRAYVFHSVRLVCGGAKLKASIGSLRHLKEKFEELRPVAFRFTKGGAPKVRVLFFLFRRRLYLLLYIYLKYIL